MLISFANWHKAERLKYKADPRTRRGPLRRSRYLSRLRLWRQPALLLGTAAVAGVALAFVIDRFEHEPVGHVERKLPGPRTADQRQPEVVRGNSGVVTITDGDTLKQGDVTYRLWGIDAAELAQTCADGWPAGRLAATRLQALTASRPIVCQEKDRDRHGRIVAICRESGEDLAVIMVREGWPGRSCGTARTMLSRRPRRRPIGSACMRMLASRRGSGGRCNATVARADSRLSAGVVTAIFAAPSHAHATARRPPSRLVAPCRRISPAACGALTAKPIERFSMQVPSEQSPPFLPIPAQQCLEVPLTSRWLAV